MIHTTSKTGRPQAVFRTSWGEQIPGLMRLADGRWRLSGPEKTTFTESDERLAVARFLELTQHQRPTVTIPVATAEPTLDSIQEAGAILAKSIHSTMGDGKVQFSSQVDESQMWAWMRHQILRYPERCATMTGIEWLAYGPRLTKPDSPTMKELIECYAAKPTITSEEVARCRRFWKEFVDATNIKDIGQLTHDHVKVYEVAIAKLGLKPKSVKHRYTGIRTVISYGLRRGMNPEDCRRALDTLAMLEVENTNPLNPNPISRVNFWKMYGAAEDAGDQVFAALLMMSLNCCLYSSEVGAVRWNEVDLKRGEFVTRRRKTGVVRVGVLWPETVKVLKKLPKEKETVFNTCIQAYNRFSVHRDWTRYREVAKVKDVTHDMIRDAAFTTACRQSLDQARVLAGHKLPGATDSYVLRDPRFVADACAAIRKEYVLK